MPRTACVLAAIHSLADRASAPDGGVRAILGVLILLVLVTSVAFAVTSEVEKYKWETAPLYSGEGLFVPCNTGIVTAYVMDGMAVVECHPNDNSKR